MDHDLSLQVMQWAIAASGPVLTVIVGYIAKTLHGIDSSVQELNSKMIVVVQQVGFHEQRFEMQDKRLIRLEERYGR